MRCRFSSLSITVKWFVKSLSAKVAHDDIDETRDTKMVWRRRRVMAVAEVVVGW
jgi:hypothetical protein